MNEIEDLREALASAKQMLSARDARLRQLELILSGLQTIDPDDEPSAAIARAFELLREALTFERAMALQPQEDGFVCIASTDKTVVGAAWSAGPFLTRVATGRGAVTPDASRVPEWATNPQREAPEVGAIFAPLTTAEGPGLLVLCSDRRGAYSAADLVLVEKLGLIISQALAAAQRRRLAEAVRRSEVEREAAVHANEVKSRFFANMSHELRTPLNGVVAVADVLSRSRLAPRDQEMVDVILHSGRMLERLLNDVLDFTKIEAGRLELEERPFDLCAELKSVFDLFAAKAETKGLDLRISISEAVAGWYVGDSLRLRQVVSNLLSNAEKFTESGWVAVTVDSEPSDGGERIVIQVRDTGCGFDPDFALRIFERFEQEDSSITRRFGGTGLGLPIARSLAQLMGGDILCQSEPNAGATFEFSFFARRTKAPEDAGEAAVTPTAPGKALRVLVAEDNPTNQKIIGMILDLAGIGARYVENGEEACRAVRDEPFDVILMDLQMPVMDGLTATRKIRAWAQETGALHTPLIVVSANAMTHHVDEALAAGADGHIAKPINPGQLLSAITACVEASASSARNELVSSLHRACPLPS